MPRAGEPERDCEAPSLSGPFSLTPNSLLSTVSAIFNRPALLIIEALRKLRAFYAFLHLQYRPQKKQYLLKTLMVGATRGAGQEQGSLPSARLTRRCADYLSLLSSRFPQ